MDALAAAQYGIAPALASALLHSLWQGTLLAIAAGLTLRAMRRAGPAWRHTVAMLFMVAMLVAPLAQFLGFWLQPTAELYESLLPAMTRPQPVPGEVFVQQSSPIATLVVLFWLIGAGLMLARHLGALAILTRMERAPYDSLPPTWLIRFDQLRQRLAIGRSVAVRLSEEVLVPCTARLLRPVIWLPLATFTQTPADHIEALIAHELAHIARSDWLWNGVQCVIESLLFFHPAVWWLGRRVRQERELACDELAVVSGGDAVALAEALLSLECGRGHVPRLALAAGGGSLLHRINRLLSGPPSRGRWGAWAALAAGAVSCMLLLAQMSIAGGGLPDLQIRSSTDGVLGPGDFREIAASGVDKQRFYRESFDSQGKRTEAYWENGRAHPIDGEVRNWISVVSRLGTGAPSKRAEPADGVEYQALRALVAAHPSVRNQLGVPVKATSQPVDGAIRLTDGTGEADVSIPMSGPKGAANVRVEAVFANGAWTLKKVEID